MIKLLILFLSKPDDNTNLKYRIYFDDPTSLEFKFSFRKKQNNRIPYCREEEANRAELRYFPASTLFDDHLVGKKNGAGDRKSSLPVLCCCSPLASTLRSDAHVDHDEIRTSSKKFVHGPLLVWPTYAAAAAAFWGFVTLMGIPFRELNVKKIKYILVKINGLDRRETATVVKLATNGGNFEKKKRKILIFVFFLSLLLLLLWNQKEMGERKRRRRRRK